MRYLMVLALAVSMNCEAQLKSFIIGVNGDTLNRVDAKGLKQGPWVIHMPPLRDERGYDEQGYFLNDIKEGEWKRFSLDGDLLAIESYRFGYKDGKCVYFTNAGDPIR